MIYKDYITVKTENGTVHNLTFEIQKIIGKSGISEGIVHIFNVGSTAAIVQIEYEPGLEKDLPEILNKLIPPSRHYGHEKTWNDGNGHSHLQASILGPDLTLPLEKGQPVLGTWQQIVHLECDNKPRTREIKVTVLGE